MDSVSTIMIHQNFLDIYYPQITVTSLQEKALTEEILTSFFNDVPLPRAIGIAASYSPKGTLTVLGLAFKAQVLLIQLSSGKQGPSGAPDASPPRKLLQDIILNNDDCTINSFDTARIALRLFDRGMRVANAIDIPEICQVLNRDPAKCIGNAMNGTDTKINPDNIRLAFEAQWDQDKSKNVAFLALRAWIPSYIAELDTLKTRFDVAERVDTTQFSVEELEHYSNMDRGDQHLDSTQSTQSTHEFSPSYNQRNKAKVKQERFTQRLHKSQDVQAKVQDENGAEYYIHGRTSDVSGCNAIIKTKHNLEGKSILELTSTQSTGPTIAEQKKAQSILKHLQGKSQLSQSPFIQFIWHYTPKHIWPDTWFSQTSVPPVDPPRQLNSSQKSAIIHMLQQQPPISLVQGPPGTGKTSVIATFTEIAVAAGHTGIYLVAQSNVAVRNIAEKLANIGFDKWRLLVSKDFRFDWHDHLYGMQISNKVIQSDEFTTAAKELEDCPVILCTLSMLANQKFFKFTNKLPIKTLVVDEASQIKLSDYIYPLSNNPTITKLCFIGDDKQLPPYGQEQTENIKSIFEVDHVRAEALMLDTQYRMPPQIGEFISDAMYDGQLKSNPSHPGAGEETCFFVNIESKEVKNGTSYINNQELDAIVKMAAHFQEEEAHFKIITPYDAQRTTLENALKDRGLDANNKCFNVDSFQGNEEEIIILSLVRSKELGFLNDARRTNVMLTRCKRYLYVVSSWDFLATTGINSLVGRMAAHCGEEAWLDLADIECGNF